MCVDTHDAHRKHEYKPDPVVCDEKAWVEINLASLCHKWRKIECLMTLKVSTQKKEGGKQNKRIK